MAMALLRMLLLAAIVCCFLMGSATANYPMAHIVGGSFGWSVPENNKTFYADWSAPRTFGVGDKLVFPFRTGTGNVVTVDKADYEDCTQKTTIAFYYLGPTTIVLSKPGDYYFYSGTGKHCEAGQKLHVKVEEGKQGSSGSQFSFNIKLGAAAPKALSPAPSNADAAAAPAPKASAAATIQNVGIASGLFTILFSLFI
ncbi:putative cupredoxin [Rosa chinensis]|uniref:Putative cupredoxin n=1 Tax=Rosa chinensis TaxID=74649 RepID=A0A2P6P6H1_ROSCH|nr:mavicyanin [Rosa chinensis]PRQ17492.1 putative cupredoxin [Rosa chinensis]